MRLVNMSSVIIGVFAVFAMLLIVSGCNDDPDNKRQHETVDKVRGQDPIHILQYSQTYDTINKWLERWDSSNKVSYVYLVADTGQTVGYYVAQGRPVSTCTFLTKPYEMKGSSSNGYTSVPAPALDGVYYDECGTNSVYFFTAETDAFVEIGGDWKYFVVDQPLDLNVEELKIGVVDESS